MSALTLAPLHGGAGAEVTFAGYLFHLLGQLLAFGALGLAVYGGVAALATIRNGAVRDRD